MLLLAKCTSLLAGFSHHHHEDCVALEVCFLRLLEKELKNRGAKRKIGSEVGEILTQTRRRTKWFFNLLCGQILTSTLKGIDNNDCRVSKQVSNRNRIFYFHLKLQFAFNFQVKSVIKKMTIKMIIILKKKLRKFCKISKISRRKLNVNCIKMCELY